MDGNPNRPAGLDDASRDDLTNPPGGEDEAAKKQLVTLLAALGYDKLLVSNTSSISITRRASAYSSPEKFMGMHFMNPVPVQPGCELIRGFRHLTKPFRRPPNSAASLVKNRSSPKTKPDSALTGCSCCS